MSDLFDLKQAILDWRRQMAAGGIKTPDLLEELEAHLRDEIERHMKSGTNAREAFASARQNLGNADALRKEFRKVRRVRLIAEKLMLGICALLVAAIVLLSVCAVFMCFTGWGERLAASAGVACILLVACGFRRLLSYLPAIADWRLRYGTGLGCIAAGFILPPLLLDLVWPQFGVRADDQTPAIVLWAGFLLTLLSCAGVGLLLGGRHNKTLGTPRPAPNL